MLSSVEATCELLLPTVGSRQQVLTMCGHFANIRICEAR